MVNAAQLHIGDKVKIVDEWGGDLGQNNQGLMDKWLGHTMTIAEFLCDDDSYMYMLEDVGDQPGGGQWVWNKEMIDYVVPVCEPPQISDDDILSVIFG